MGCKLMCLIPFLEWIKYIRKENKKAGMSQCSDNWRNDLTAGHAAVQHSLFSCWVFSIVSISVAHKDASQLVEALRVNGADWCVWHHQEVQCVCCRPRMLNNLLSWTACCLNWQRNAPSMKMLWSALVYVLEGPWKHIFSIRFWQWAVGCSLMHTSVPKLKQF